MLTRNNTRRDTVTNREEIILDKHSHCLSVANAVWLDCWQRKKFCDLRTRRETLRRRSYYGRTTIRIDSKSRFLNWGNSKIRPFL